MIKLVVGNMYKTRSYINLTSSMEQEKEYQLAGHLMPDEVCQLIEVRTTYHPHGSVLNLLLLGGTSLGWLCYYEKAPYAWLEELNAPTSDKEEDDSQQQ